MTVKSLRKQLAAAIAMTLVATVALGSSTYAWFVSNSQVTATTATISAQSNAPFLMIDEDAITEDSLTEITFTDADTALYPAQVVKAAGGEAYKDASGDDAEMTAEQPLFQSAYAQLKTETTILAGSRFNVGTADDAVEGEYAIHESFVIGTYDDKAGSFADLKVASVTLVNNSDSELTDALCVLVTCGDNWAVYKADANGAVLTAYNDGTSAVGVNTSGVLADTIPAGDSVDVDVYVFYDGSEDSVYTTNLENLTAIGATIAFTATPVSTNGMSMNP
ncbi:MAG: hypothetical protein IK081_11790 [Lachnospiraceae bacterium]|nr:hypothetical protein [Lachnospiraceae bacterium]